MPAWLARPILRATLTSVKIVTVTIKGTPRIKISRLEFYDYISRIYDPLVEGDTVRKSRSRFLSATTTNNQCRCQKSSRGHCARRCFLRSNFQGNLVNEVERRSRRRSALLHRVSSQHSRARVISTGLYLSPRKGHVVPSCGAYARWTSSMRAEHGRD